MMAVLAKPSISFDGIPFDATQAYTMNFTAVGGNQIFKNEIEIYNNATNIRIFTNIEENNMYTHTIPANSLINDSTHYYQMHIRVYDDSGNYGEWSDWILFKCLSSATITFTNIESNKVKNQNELFKITYTQAQNSAINSYEFFLYNSNKEQLDTSGEIFYASNTSLSFQFSTKFDNDSNYYVRALATSVDNLVSDTGYIEFTAQFIQPLIQNVLKCENVCKEGKIKAEARVIRVLFQIGANPVTFIDGEWVDLTQGGWIYTDKDNGFSLDGGDWTLGVWCKDMIDNSTLITLFDNYGKLNISYANQTIYLRKWLTGYTDYPALLMHEYIGENNYGDNGYGMGGYGGNQDAEGEKPDTFIFVQYIQSLGMYNFYAIKYR